MREQLRQLLRRARFEGHTLERQVDDILDLLGLEGVDDQPPAPPDQPPQPAPA